MQIDIVVDKGELLLARGEDGVRVLGEMLILANYTAEFAKEPLFIMLEQCRNAIEAGTYLMLYRRAKNGDSELVVPVGFYLMAHLSEPMDALFMNGLRALTPAELRSGPRFRCNFAIFPYTGYFDKGLPMLWEAYPDEVEFGYKKYKDAVPSMRFMRRK